MRFFSTFAGHTYAKMKLTASISALLFICASASGKVIFTDTAKSAVLLDADKSSGLSAVCILWNPVNAKMTYRSTSPESIRWYRFGADGATRAEELTDNVSIGKGISELTLSEGNCGYIVEDGNVREYIWIVDYTEYMPRFTDIGFGADSDCNSVELDFSGSASTMTYHGVTGRSYIIDRDFILTFDTLRYDEVSDTYSVEPVERKYASLEPLIRVKAPLCDTEFRLSGDRFLAAWDMTESIVSPRYTASAVEARTYARQLTRDISNEQTEDTDGLGGSAPVEIEFEATVSDAVVFTEWQISDDPEFEAIDIRHNDMSFTYTFNDEGLRYARFVAGNADGTCEYFSPTYEISIGKSDIKCPNAFSPGNNDGVNDEWKVSYKSILNFDCRIFNSWGIEVARLKNPADGWDGRYKGKNVPSGVYYYIIDAKGADGKIYHLKGDINIIKSKNTY